MNIEVENGYSQIVQILNEEFRTFGDGIADIIREKYNLEDVNSLQFLKEKCVQNNVPIEEIGNANTLRSWFSSDKRPKKGNDSRNKIFAIAFALKLDFEETKDLFHKVYLDRAVNYRRYEDFIYYYCIRSGLSFQHANSLISKVSFNNVNSDDLTMKTEFMIADATTLECDEEVLAYIHSHAHNFSISNQMAKEILINQKKKVIEVIGENISILYTDKSDYKGYDLTSDSFIWKTIIDRATTKENGRGTVTIPFKNTEFPKEIKHNFPQVKSLSEKNDSYDELRKSIILLFSFWYWLKSKSESIDPDVDEDYAAELNKILDDAGMPPLYYGNPYDWMFLYCTVKSENSIGGLSSIDVFKEIIAYVLDKIDE